MIRSSTSVTPGADQATVTAASCSAQELTAPERTTTPGNGLSTDSWYLSSLALRPNAALTACWVSRADAGYWLGFFPACPHLPPPAGDGLIQGYPDLAQAQAAMQRYRPQPPEGSAAGWPAHAESCYQVDRGSQDDGAEQSRTSGHAG